MLEELSGGRPPAPPSAPGTGPGSAPPSSWSAGTVSSPDDAGVFPPAGIPSYAPEPPPVPPPTSAPPSTPAPPQAPAAPDLPPPLPPLPAAPGSAYPTILPADDRAEEGRSRSRRPDRAADGADDSDGRPADDRSDRSKLLPLLVLAAVVLAGIVVLFNVLSGDDDDTLATPTTAPSRPATSTAPSAQASAPTPVRTYSSAQIDQALEDPHFKHGYNAGRAKKAASGPVTDPVATCRELGLAERGTGYPWGAHDRQGCLVGITA